MTSNTSDCLSGAPPVVLDAKATCNLGFYCPNNSAAHPPQYCPPTSDCQARRLLQVVNICNEAQGSYEPTICRAGYYCPKGGKEQLPCPRGTYCPVGSYTPRRCVSGSICPPMSQRQIHTIGLDFIIAIDLILFALAVRASLWSKFRNSRRRRKTRCRDSEGLTIDTHRKRRSFKARPDIAVSEPQPETDVLLTELQKFIESCSQCIEGRELGLSFDFADIGLTLADKQKSILSKVTGSIQHGSMWGVMGPSGAGKSTFLNLLMGKAKPTSGTISVNGVQRPVSEYKKIIGYVPQDDVVLPDLTVRENILHSARIRLPSSWNDAQIQTHVDRLISCLELTHVQHNLVGDALKPMISGGQRKRVSIGLELAAAPMALFLDEPTSGLDATSALSIVKLLKGLSQVGVTVVAIVHQPRPEIFFSLDKVLLLSEGRQVYHGKTEDAISYFEQLGFTFPSQCNPADNILDIISGHSRIDRKTMNESSVAVLIENWERCEREAEGKCQDAGTELSDQQESALRRTIRGRGASWLKQMKLCFLRAMRQQTRQASSFTLEVSVGGVAGLMVGLAVYNLRGQLFQGLFLPPFQLLSSATNYTLIPELGLLCSLAIGLAASAPGVKIFGEEKQVYWREASSGHSRSAYYMGKVLSTLFRISLSALHFTVFFTLLATPTISFGEIFLANLLYFYSIYGLGSCVSMITRREDGPLLSMIVSLIIGIFGGYGPSLLTVKQWHLEWFWRICPGTWFAEAYYTGSIVQQSYLYDIDAAAQWTGYTLGRYGLDVSMLFVIGTVYRGLAYLGLILLNRQKQV